MKTHSNVIESPLERLVALLADAHAKRLMQQNPEKVRFTIAPDVAVEPAEFVEIIVNVHKTNGAHPPS